VADWPDATTFAQVWANTVATRPNADFLTFEAPDGKVTNWTYKEFDHIVASMATELVNHGVVPGASVHLALTNSPTFIAVWIATVRLGGWIVPSDPMGRTAEFDDHIERTKPVVGFFGRDRSDVYRAAVSDMALIPIDEADAAFRLDSRRAIHRLANPHSVRYGCSNVHQWNDWTPQRCRDFASKLRLRRQDNVRSRSFE
jgi:crotonobetaine/carnitine-CoA ligase